MVGYLPSVRSQSRSALGGGEPGAQVAGAGFSVLLRAGEVEMRRDMLRSVFWTGMWLGICVGASSPQQAASQARQHAVLPPSFVGTPYSAAIEAEAKWLIARGDFLESVAIARKIHAEAVALEMENWVNYVDAYFKRRELWREYRRKEHPDYLQQVENRQKVMKKRIAEQYQDIKGDLTRHLNWLLTELCGPTMAYQLFPGDRNSPGLDMDQKLNKEDLPQIWFSDNGPAGSRLVFSATDPKVLATPWPRGLLEPELEPARTQFEMARDVVLQQIKTEGRVSQENANALLEAVNQLFTALEAAYPREQRSDASVFLTYNTAKHYLQSLLAQVHRAIRTSDRSVFDGSLSFQGDSILDLIQHMYQRGLVFAPPQPGGERVYRNLMTDMRNIYLALAPE